MTQPVDEVVNEIAQYLGGKEKEVKDELDRYIKLGVPLAEAKRSVLKKLFPYQSLRDLEPDASGVDLLCRIISVSGQSDNQFHGILGDQTATRPFLADHDFSLILGRAVFIHNASTTEWQGEPKVLLGPDTRVLDASTNPANRRKEHKVEDLKGGLRDVAVKGRVLSLEEREITAQGETKKIYKGVLADPTGKIRFTAWHDFSLHQGENVRITGGYVKAWKSLPSLNFDRQATVEVLPDGELPPAEQLSRDRKVPISDLYRLGGITGVVVEGTLLDIRRSGLIFRCPQCRRFLQEGTCRVHGSVQGTPDLRIKGVMDDGTGALAVVLGREITEKVLGLTLDQCIEKTDGGESPDVIAEALSNRLLLRPIRIHGTVTSDEFGPMIVGTGAEVIELGVRKEMARLLEEMNAA